MERQGVLTGISGSGFGLSVSMSDESIVVGAPHENSKTGSFSVFTRNGSGWSLQQKLHAGDGQINDTFGFPVAISGIPSLLVLV